MINNLNCHSTLITNTNHNLVIIVNNTNIKSNVGTANYQQFRNLGQDLVPDKPAKGKEPVAMVLNGYGFFSFTWFVRN